MWTNLIQSNLSTNVESQVLLDRRHGQDEVGTVAGDVVVLLDVVQHRLTTCTQRRQWRTVLAAATQAVALANFLDITLSRHSDHTVDSHVSDHCFQPLLVLFDWRLNWNCLFIPGRHSVVTCVSILLSLATVRLNHLPPTWPELLGQTFWPHFEDAPTWEIKHFNSFTCRHTLKYFYWLSV